MFKQNGVLSESFGFLLMPDFPLTPFAAAVDVLHLSNYVSEKALYKWCTSAPAETTVRSRNGIRSQADYTLESAPALSAIVVCSGMGGSHHDIPAVLSWLRDRHATGTRVGGISTGSWTLARAGLLRERRCTVHWEDMDAFRETFPDMNVTSSLFESDGRVFTCSGASAVIDMFLSFVAAGHGVTLATAVADQFAHGPLRPDHTNQRTDVGARMGIYNQAVVDAVVTMEQNLETPMALNEIAGKSNVSSRHLERLFHRDLGTTPQLYYRALRLRHAQSLVRRSTLSISEIAYASGFCSSSYFAKCYAEFFGNRPNQDRSFK